MGRETVRATVASSFAAYEVVQLTVALEHEPAGAEHRVAGYKPNPGQDRKRAAS